MPERRALVTGASGAIGGAIARRLAAQGVPLALHYCGSAEKAHALAEELGGALCLQADLREEKAVQDLVAEASEAIGPPTILVNAAGVLVDSLVAFLKADDWDRCVDVNLKAAYLCTKHVLRGMSKARWGRIVHIGSTAGLTGDASRANYAAAKAGLVGLARSVAREVGRGGITVNVVCPGVIESPMTEDMKEPRRKELLGRIPLGRFGAPEDVAAAVDYLVSESAGYVTGSVLVVDGGLSM